MALGCDISGARSHATQRRSLALGGDAINIVGFLLCATLLLARIAHHAVWRDEAQAWLIVQAADSLIDLLILEGEGHPPLYYWILYLTSTLGNDLWLAKIPTVIFSVATLVVVWFFTPFTFVEKLMISLGFFLSWQYGVFSRSYIVGAFFLLLYAVFHDRWREYPVPGGLVLGAASLTHVYFAMAASCLAALSVLLWLREGRALKRIALLTIPFGVCLALSAASVILSIPATETVERITQPAGPQATALLQQMAQAFLEGLPMLGLKPLLVTLVFVLLIACFWRNRLGGLVFLAGAGCIAAVQTMIYGTGRHSGVIYFLFVAVYAIAYSACNKTPARALLALSMLAGLFILPRTLTTPYSAALEAADIITARGLERANWVAYPDAPATATFAALKRSVYGLQCGCEYTYVDWRRRHKAASDAKLGERLQVLLSVESPVYVLVSKPHLDKFLRLARDRAVEQLAETKSAILPSETFVIFKGRGSSR